MKNNFKKHISLLLLLAFILPTLLLFTSCSAGSDTVYSKEQLTENYTADEKSHGSYVWKYFDAWDFPKFTRKRIQNVEVIYRDCYYKDLEDSKTLAKAAAKIFIENYYDTTDLENEDAVTSALIYSYVAAVGDRYSFYREPEEYEDFKTDMSGSFVGIGVSASSTEDKTGINIVSVMEGGPAERAGLLAGDIITAVDGISVAERGYQESVDSIKGESGTAVKITVNRGGDILDFNIIRAHVVNKSVTFTLDTDTRVGYIKISAFNDNTDEQFIEAVNYMTQNGALGIIYDLRSNGGGYLSAVEAMVDYIAPDGITLVSFSHGYDDAYISRDGHSLALPSIVICNGQTASAAELFTASIRDLAAMGHFDAKILGTTTYGKGVMQNTYPFLDGAAITLTVAYYNPPSGINYDGIGIIPDVVIEPAASHDAQLSSAYDEILKMIK